MKAATSILHTRIHAVSRLFGSKPDADEEALRRIRPLLYASHVPENFMDFGLPRAAEERKQLRRERLWRHVYRVGIAFALLGIGFIAGYNIHLRIAEAAAAPDLATFNTRGLAWLQLNPRKAGCWSMKLVNTPYTYRVCRWTDPNGRIHLRTEGM